MKKKELYPLQRGLIAVKDLGGSKFAYAVAKTLDRVNKEITIIASIHKPSDEFLEYDKKRIALCESHAKVDEFDAPIIVGGEYQLKSQADFDKALEALDEKHQEILEKNKELQKEIIEFLDEKIEDLKIHKVAFEDLPKGITAGQMTGILPIVMEPKNGIEE